jgi:hypothetical protein
VSGETSGLPQIAANASGVQEVFARGVLVAVQERVRPEVIVVHVMGAQETERAVEEGALAHAPRDAGEIVSTRFALSRWRITSSAVPSCETFSHEVVSRTVGVFTTVSVDGLANVTSAPADATCAGKCANVPGAGK